MKLGLMAIAATLAFSLVTSAAYSRDKECPPGIHWTVSAKGKIPPRGSISFKDKVKVCDPNQIVTSPDGREYVHLVTDKMTKVCYRGKCFAGKSFAGKQGLRMVDF